MADAKKTKTDTLFGLDSSSSFEDIRKVIEGLGTTPQQAGVDATSLALMVAGNRPQISVTEEGVRLSGLSVHIDPLAILSWVKAFKAENETDTAAKAVLRTSRELSCLVNEDGEIKVGNFTIDVENLAERPEARTHFLVRAIKAARKAQAKADKAAARIQELEERLEEAEHGDVP